MNKRTIKRKLGSVRKRIAEVVIGLEEPIELLIISMLSGGHVLVEGPPGLGKTTLATTVAKSLGGSFSRIQMTPDLLPSDIIGINVFNPYDTTWVLRRGPIFANVVLIDELNRASPKVQSAFLQAMQENGFEGVWGRQWWCPIHSDWAGFPAENCQGQNGIKRQLKIVGAVFDAYRVRIFSC